MSVTSQRGHNSSVEDSAVVSLGYKRTEVGVIPEEWNVARIDKNASIKTGSKNTQDKQEDGDYPFFVRSQEVERINSYSYDGEAVLTAGDGVGTGKVFHYIVGRFDVHQRVYRITNFSERLDGRYLFFQFSRRFFDRIMSMTAKSSVDSVRMETIAGMQIPLARPAEQRAIAEALSDVDGLLEALDALIAKKRAIKQAAMQQLLTGKTRLPGFSGEWETKRLGDIADIKNGATPSTQMAAYWNGTIPWCTPTDITGTPGKYLLATERNITKEGLISCAASLLPVGTLLLCSRATIGEIKIAATPVCTNQGFKSLVCKDGVSNEFLYYLLATLKPQMIERAIGSTFLEIGKRDVAAIEVRLPPFDEDEQHAIAAVLSDMDAEIAVLERRRDKTRAVKQGMMQQLLTGRVRLVKPDRSTGTSVC